MLATDRPTIRVSREQLVSMLRGIKGAKPVTIVTETDPGKSAKHKGICVKQSHVNGMVNWHYEKAVNRQLEREGKDPSFEVQPRKWGERVAGTPLVEHKGNFYLEMKVERVLDTQYFLMDPHGGYIPTTKEAVVEHLRPSRGAPNQGVDKQIILRDYKVDSIITLRMGGREYQIG